MRWINKGDDNTKVFHQSTKLKRVQNRMNTIKKEDGKSANNSTEVVDAFLEFYQALLGNTDGAVNNVELAVINKGCILKFEQ